jgi:hypothetical protein
MEVIQNQDQSKLLAGQSVDLISRVKTVSSGSGCGERSYSKRIFANLSQED